MAVATPGVGLAHALQSEDSERGPVLFSLR
jgi:hypothetical protein